MVQKMPIPTRSAPRPPASYGTQNSAAWTNNDSFGATSSMQPTQKKKPPPRPPPPRFGKNYSSKQDDGGNKATRPTELLSNIFGKRSQKKPENSNSTYTGSRLPPPHSRTNFTSTNTEISLIDLSPPGSPTFTGRSSSDGLSVHSFGSDGNSNPSVFTSSGNTSQTESPFEDDFDFFGNNAMKNSTSAETWNRTNNMQDPFSPMSIDASTSTKRFGDTCFFAHNEANDRTTSRLGFETNNPTMPTIIRARPPKPPPPKTIATRNLAPIVVDFNAIPTTSTFSKIVNDGPEKSTIGRFGGNDTWPDDFDDSSSPPMPSVPPPAPPSEFFSRVDDNAQSIGSTASPHGLALYDFAASQPGDLQLKQGDVVHLLRTVNDEWLEGRIGNLTGIFPANYVDVVVPLSERSDNIAKALYTFAGTTWDDLPFQEGDKITVLSRISNDWLYGECEGKKGQFPANYVDRIPHDLPKYS